MTSPLGEAQRVRAIVGAHKSLRGALLPILHDIQHEFGFVSPSHVSLLADSLKLSQAEVHGVLSFYHDFRSSPPGRHVVKVCVAEAVRRAAATISSPMCGGG